jgi:serine protease AprX
MSRSTALVRALALALPGSSVHSAVPASADKISPGLARAFERSATGRVEMLVVLAEQADLAPAAALATKAEKGRFVFERLTATAARTQGPLLAELARLGAPARPFWVVNFIWTEGDSALAARLAARADVARLDANPKPGADQAGGGPRGGGARGAGCHRMEHPQGQRRRRLGAAPGITGQGAVIAGQDTGYQWDHPALKSKYRGWNGAVGRPQLQLARRHPHRRQQLWRGLSRALRRQRPRHPHHGDDGRRRRRTNQVGMAPGARWIGCRNMNAGAGTPTTYIECFEWFIAPTNLANQNPDPGMAPDVINNSWGCPRTRAATPATSRSCRRSSRTCAPPASSSPSRPATTAPPAPPSTLRRRSTTPSSRSARRPRATRPRASRAAAR